MKIGRPTEEQAAVIREAAKQLLQNASECHQEMFDCSAVTSLTVIVGEGISALCFLDKDLAKQMVAAHFDGDMDAASEAFHGLCALADLYNETAGGSA